MTTQDKLFTELDSFMYKRLSETVENLKLLNAFVDEQNISLLQKVKSSGEKPEDQLVLGDLLIRTVSSLSKLLAEYKEFKNTWQLTTA